MLELNPRIASMLPSQTLAITGRAKALRREGKPIVSLSAGEPDFGTPQPIVEAAIQAIHDGAFGYTENAGLLALREAICNKLSRDNGLHYEPAQIICSNGAKQSVAQAVQVLCRPEDEVLVPIPFWVSYPEMVKLAGGNPILVRTQVANGYKMTPEELENAITEKTRLLILCSPSNPTGAVYTEEELEALATVLRKHPQIYIVADEIYEKVIYDATHISFASLEGMYERTVTVNGFSKAYAMTGWRLGYLAAPLEITKAVGKLQSQFTSGPNHITQCAGIIALQMDESPIHEMVHAFRERRDYVLQELNAIEGIACPKPEGAFYLFPNVAHYFGKKTPQGKTIEDDTDLCMYLLEEKYVAMVMGSAFGEPEGLRLSYAASMEDLKEAMKRFKEGLATLT